METEQKKQDQFSKVIPIRKFIFLSIITFGFYELVWFYRNWGLLLEKKGLNISPAVRTIFAPLFAGSIAKHLQKYLKEKDVPCNYSSVMIGISYFIIAMFSMSRDPYFLISFLTFIPMLPMIKATNTYWQKEEGNLPLKKYNWWQIILIIMCIILFLLSVIGSFITE